MPVVAENLTMGPGDLYYKPFDAAAPITAEPANTTTAINAAPSDTDWDDLGGTSDGITISLNQEYTELTADQVVDKIGRRLTSRDITLATNLVEPTLQNLARIGNELPGQVVAATGTGGTRTNTTYTPAFGGTTASNPNYCSIIMDGWGAGVTATGGQLRRRVHVRKALSVENVEFAYSKSDQTVYSVTFAGHYVSATVAPYLIRDDAPVVA